MKRNDPEQPLSPRSHKGKVGPETDFSKAVIFSSSAGLPACIRGAAFNQTPIASSSRMGQGRRSAPDRPWPRALNGPRRPRIRLRSTPAPPILGKGRAGPGRGRAPDWAALPIRQVTALAYSRSGSARHRPPLFQARMEKFPEKDRAVRLRQGHGGQAIPGAGGIF